MEEGKPRPSIVKPVLILAGVIVILAAIKAAAEILGLFFLAVFLAISFAPAFGWLKSKGAPDWLAVSAFFASIIGFTLLLFGLAWFPLSQIDDKIPVYQANLSSQVALVQDMLQGLGVDVSRFEEEGLLDVGKVLGFLADVVLAISNAMFLVLVVVLTAIFMVLAVIGGHTGVVRILVEAGADLNIQARTSVPGFYRKTALSLARDSGRTAIIKILAAADATI